MIASNGPKHTPKRIAREGAAGGWSGKSRASRDSSDTAPNPDRPAVNTKWSHIVQAHGGGGQLTDALLAASVLPRLGNPALNELLDSALLSTPREQLAFTIDSYVVQPLIFPGGDIGRLAVSGTVNDLAVCGARPLGIALSLILGEGLPRRTLEHVIDSIAATAADAGTSVVTGDTKVIGHIDDQTLFITTAGIGDLRTANDLHPSNVIPGDVLLINGPIADHGIAVMLARELPQVRSAVRSDVAPLNSMIERLLGDVPEVVFMRDPTRGGLAGVAADLAQRSGQRVVLVEEQLPIRPETRHAADMLGLDPLDVANEGKVLIAVRPTAVERALAALRSHELGRGACVIGYVGGEADGLCELRTLMGGRRIVQKPYGEQLPRIC